MMEWIFDEMYEDFYSLCEKDPALQIAEPEWTEEDEKLRSEWIELEYRKYES